MLEKSKAMEVVTLYDKIRALFAKLWGPFVSELHSPHAALNKEGFLLDNFYLPQLLAVLYSSVGNSNTTRPWPMLVLQSEYMFEDEKRAFGGLLEFFHPGQADKQDAIMRNCVKIMARRQIPFGAGLNKEIAHNIKKSWMNKGEYSEQNAKLLQMSDATRRAFDSFHEVSLQQLVRALALLQDRGVQVLPRVNTGEPVVDWWKTPVSRAQPSLFEALSSKTAKLRSQLWSVL